MSLQSDGLSPTDDLFVIFTVLAHWKNNKSLKLTRLNAWNFSLSLCSTRLSKLSQQVFDPIVHEKEAFFGFEHIGMKMTK